MEKRKTYLDWLRVIAIALVILNHLPAFALRETGRFGFVFPAVLVQMNVPLFFMISGALLLSRDERMKTLMTKRVLRMLAVIPIAFVGLYLLRSLHETVLHGEAFHFSLKECIYGLLSGSLAPQDSGPYWYLYAYLGYLLMLPFLRGAARHMRRSHFMLLTALHAGLFTLLPVLNAALGGWGLEPLRITGELRIPLAAEACIFYPLAGYWLEHGAGLERMSGRKVILFGCLALCAAAGAALLYGNLQDSEALDLAEWCLAFAAFLSAKWLSARRRANTASKWPARIRALSGLVFGIYLLDPYLKLVLFGAYYKAGSHLPEPLCSLLWIPVSMAAGGFLTWLMKKIPGVRKLL